MIRISRSWLVVSVNCQMMCHGKCYHCKVLWDSIFSFPFVKQGPVFPKLKEVIKEVSKLLYYHLRIQTALIMAATWVFSFHNSTASQLLLSSAALQGCGRIVNSCPALYQLSFEMKLHYKLLPISCELHLGSNIPRYIDNPNDHFLQNQDFLQLNLLQNFNLNFISCSRLKSWKKRSKKQQMVVVLYFISCQTS